METKRETQTTQVRGRPFQKGHKTNVGRRCSPETRKKISEAQKGIPKKKHTEAWKREASERMKKQHALGLRKNVFTPEVRKKMSISAQNRPSMSNETKQKIGKAHKGDKNASWKGEHVGYSGLHKWVTRALGTPQECWNCWDDNKKKYEWCSVKHKYERKKENWVRLCTACHRNYDQNKIDISEAISHQKKLNEKNTT